MRRVTVTVGGLFMLLVCLMEFPEGAVGAEEPSLPAQDPKAQPPKEQKAESKKEELKKEEPKKEEPKGQVQASKPQEAKPSEPAAKPESKKEEPKKEEPKASPPVQKPQESKPQEPPKPAQESKPPEAPAPKPTVPPIIPMKLALMADSRLFPYDINVEISGETAELSGKVSTDGEKAAAAEIAQRVEGVKSVTNNIEVSKDLGKIMAKKKDEIILQYVKDRFGKSKTLETAHFDVKLEDGIISLSGKTKFLVIVLEAAEAARQVPGVRAVKTEGIRLEGTDEN